jgi:hypothetical protein
LASRGAASLTLTNVDNVSFGVKLTEGGASR